MTIDERLEALTRAVELIAAAQIKNDERMGQLLETITTAEQRTLEAMRDMQTEILRGI